MSWRRFAVILEHLPPESEFKTAVLRETDLAALPDPEPGQFGPWSQSELLLARIGDLLQNWLWMNADPSTRPKTPPPPYPRPGVETSNVRPISPEAAAYMEYVRKNRRHPPDDWTPEVG